MDGVWVMTPGVRDLLDQFGSKYPPKAQVFDGRINPTTNLPAQDLQVIRLAIIYSLERRDMADELSVSDDYGNTLVSEMYVKLGVKDLLEKPYLVEDYLGTNTLSKKHFNEILNHLKTSSKVKDQEALAFHILTAPEVTPLCGDK